MILTEESDHRRFLRNAESSRLEHLVLCRRRHERQRREADGVQREAVAWYVREEERGETARSQQRSWSECRMGTRCIRGLTVRRAVGRGRSNEADFSAKTKTDQLRSFNAWCCAQPSTSSFLPRKPYVMGYSV